MRIRKFKFTQKVVVNLTVEVRATSKARAKEIASDGVNGAIYDKLGNAFPVCHCNRCLADGISNIIISEIDIETT